MHEFTLICCVVNMGDAAKLLKIAKKYGVKKGVISIGRGTLNSPLLAFLQINEIRKEIVSMVVETELAAEATKSISKDMAFEKPHHGIAFTHPVSVLLGNNHKIDKADKADKINKAEEDTKTNSTINSEINEVETSMYNAIYVIVERGKAEDVIEAAKNAGARGGTIINARGSGSQETHKLFSIEIEPEKEKVIIIAKRELKDNIVEAIKNHMHIDEPGNGVIFVLDVNEVYGLHQG